MAGDGQSFDKSGKDQATQVADNATAAFQNESEQLRGKSAGAKSTDSSAGKSDHNSDPSSSKRGQEGVKTLQDSKSKESVQSLDLNFKRPPEKRTVAEMENLNYLKEELLSFKQMQLLRLNQLDKENGKDEKSPEEVARELEAIRTAVSRETDALEFGINTRFLYREMVTWLQRDAIPTALKVQAELGVAGPMPPFAFRIKGENAGQFDMELDTELDRTKLPTESDLDKLSAAGKWLTDEKKLIEKTKRELHTLVEAVQMGVQAMDFLHQAGGNFPLNLPPNCQVERDAEGNVSKVNLDLPYPLSQKTPEDREKIKQLKDWHDRNMENIKQASKELLVASAGQHLFSNLEFQAKGGSGIVKFQRDVNGNVSATTQAPAENDKQDGQKYNLITTDYSVKDLGNGKIEVTPSVQYWDVPRISPHNIWKTAVGEKVEMPKVTYSATDFVPVVKEGKTELVQAKDLAKFHADEADSQKSSLKKKLILDAVVSTALIGSGAYAAYAATSTLAAGAGVLRAAFGLAGAMEGSAGAQEHTETRWAMHARHAYFAFDALHNAHKFSSVVGRKLLGMAPAVGAGVEGAAATGEAVGAIKEMSRAETALKVGAAVTGLAIDMPMNYVVISDIWDSWEREAESRHNAKATAAAIRIMHQPRNH